MENHVGTLTGKSGFREESKNSVARKSSTDKENCLGASANICMKKGKPNDRDGGDKREL